MINQLNRLLSGCENDCDRVVPGVLSLFVVCLHRAVAGVEVAKV